MAAFVHLAGSRSVMVSIYSSFYVLYIISRFPTFGLLCFSLPIDTLLLGPVLFWPHSFSIFTITMAPGDSAAVRRAKNYFGLNTPVNRPLYLRIRTQIRNLCQQLGVINQASDRWWDVCVRTIDENSFFSRRQTYRRLWNQRDSSLAGQNFYTHLRNLIADSAGNNRDRLSRNYRSTRQPVPIVDCYHLTDNEASCVSLTPESTIIVVILTNLG